MQLRIARLCLDCEELFVGDRCPVCASTQYAFLAQWLPTEERRKWRRAPARVADTPKGFDRIPHGFRRFVAWLFDDEPLRSHTGSPRTRASDFVPAMKFDEEPDKKPATRPARASDPAKGHVR